MSKSEQLEFLKRIVFKIAICSERIEHFVFGRIRARNAMLGVFDASIKDKTSDNVENPFENRNNLAALD